MLVSSDFLGYLNRKKDNDKRSSPLVAAALKSSPGAKEKAPPVERTLSKIKRDKKEEVEYLNAKPSNLNIVL
jgi:hypothetical protein